MSRDILTILETDQLEPSASAAAMCDKIRAKHQGRVLALLYYGSSLRAINDPAKMLDFYVIVDSYRKTHKNPIRAGLNALIPPAVYYMENENADGTVSNCKYSILSLRAFERRTTKKALLSMIWGRFSQPCILLFPKDESIRKRIQNARANALKHIARETIPLVNSSISATKFWARGFKESYRTELRPESSGARSEEIVTRYKDRYENLAVVFFGNPNSNGEFTVPKPGGFEKITCKWRWFWRRFWGKPATAVRVLNSAMTFDGGIDYVLHKLKNYSGVTIEISEHQRRHPILWSPILGWKLYRKGAFK
ncbi:MAG: hypothetical protein V3U57_08815 [Robiginitomaculum sp.]